MNDQTYIIASTKEWHRPGFEKIAAQMAADWVLVETPGELSEAIKSHTPRYIFFLHWSWRVPELIWRQFECVCFHMTDVPYGRGGSPLQNLIVAKHEHTQLSALRMVEEMDAGPVYTKRPLSLAGRAEDIYTRAGDISFEIVRWIILTRPEPTPQIGEVVEFRRRQPNQSALPVGGTISDLYDHIRMLDAQSYPLAYLEHGEFILEFSHAELSGQDLTARVKIRARSAKAGKE